jgi:hypothetical protein
LFHTSSLSYFSFETQTINLCVSVLFVAIAFCFEGRFFPFQ